VAVSAGRELSLEVMRVRDRVALRMVPEAAIDTNPATGRPREVGQIGAVASSRIERLSLPAAAGAGWQATWAMGTTVIRVVGGLLTGEVSVSQLGGPILIARTSVEAARSGVLTLFTLIAFLSINVAVLNLLPIPILDGGQILLNVAESIKGSAFSARTREMILRAGLVAIALLFALVMFNDLKGLVKLFG
jgi:regulator of sigma E protease